MTEKTLYTGRGVCVERDSAGGYRLIAGNQILASLPIAESANILARAFDSYMPAALSLDDQLRVAFLAFRSMPGARYFVVDLLRAEANTLRVRALEAVRGAERTSAAATASHLEDLANALGSGA